MSQQREPDHPVDAFRYPRQVAEGSLDWRTIYDTKVAPFLCLGANGCLEYTHRISPTGYGRLQVGSRKDGTSSTAYAHRVAYLALKGPIPDGSQINHFCNNRRCCNQHHLTIGDATQNGKYMVQSGHILNRAVSSGLCGVHLRRTIEGYEYWVARYCLPGGKRKILYQGKDFFEACCARKSWEAVRRKLGAAFVASQLKDAAEPAHIERNRLRAEGMDP